MGPRSEEHGQPQTAGGKESDPPRSLHQECSPASPGEASELGVGNAVLFKATVLVMTMEEPGTTLTARS